MDGSESGQRLFALLFQKPQKWLKSAVFRLRKRCLTLLPTGADPASTPYWPRTDPALAPLEPRQSGRETRPYLRLTPPTRVRAVL